MELLLLDESSLLEDVALEDVPLEDESPEDESRVGVLLCAATAGSGWGSSLCDVAWPRLGGAWRLASCRGAGLDEPKLGEGVVDGKREGPGSGWPLAKRRWRVPCTACPPRACRSPARLGSRPGDKVRVMAELRRFLP